MSSLLKEVIFNKLGKDEEVPYELLLLADPSKIMIEKYLAQSDIFVAKKNEKTVGVVTLIPISNDEMEIKSIAVKPELQGQGIGSFLLENIDKIAVQRSHKSLIIGTANSSIGQLYLYQKHGFEITGLRKNFFLDNYNIPIFEHGIRSKHMIILKKNIHKA